METFAPEIRDKCQWLLQVDPAADSKFSGESEVFLLNLDSDSPAEAELWSFEEGAGLVGVGQVSDWGKDWSIDFKNSEFERLGLRDGVISRAYVPRVVDHLLIGQFISPTGASPMEWFPRMTVRRNENEMLSGRAIMIPYVDKNDSELNVVSWSEFTEMFGSHVESPEALFRGQSKSEQPLTPSYFRDSNGRTRTRYLNHITDVLRDSSCNDDAISRLVSAQHMQGGTMLLDWTESPLIAAFFAFRNDDFESTHARIYKVAPGEFRHDFPDIFGKRVLTFFKPNKFSSDLAHKRAYSQKSHLLFSKFRNLYVNSPDLCPPISHWDIPISFKSEALADLSERYGISHKTLML